MLCTCRKIKTTYSSVGLQSNHSELREQHCAYWVKPNVLPLPGSLKYGRSTTLGMTASYSSANPCSQHSPNQRPLPISTLSGSKSSHLHKVLSLNCTFTNRDDQLHSLDAPLVPHATSGQCLQGMAGPNGLE